MIEILILGIVFTICLSALGIVTYLFSMERIRNRRIMEKVDRIDIKPIENKVNKIREEENEYFRKLFEMEMFLENYRKAALIIGEKVENLEKKIEVVEKIPKDYEMTFRDLTRKVLEMDNKFTDKFKMVAEAVLKLRDEKE